MNLDEGRERSINRRHSDRIRTRPRGENDVPDDRTCALPTGGMSADEIRDVGYLKGRNIRFAARDYFWSPVLRDVPVIARRIHVPSCATSMERRGDRPKAEQNRAGPNNGFHFREDYPNPPPM